MPFAFDRFGAPDPARPVVLSVPHAGRDYPKDLSSVSRFPAERLISLEDRYADLLAEHGWRSGFSGLVARTPRALIDLNRAEQDVDPGMLTEPMASPALLSMKARGGLGLIPRRTPQLGDLWQRRFSPAEVTDRIDTHHRPYHRELASLLSAARHSFGAALLLDIHSMPPLAETSVGPPPDIVIGDRFGRSCAPHLTALAGQVAQSAGYRIAFNAPYAGGHILDRHGNPAQSIHALQIEIDRRLYLDAKLVEPGPGLVAVQALIALIATRMNEALDLHSEPMAAE